MYKLKNIKTKEEHLCDKVIIDGFDYYVSDEKYAVGENCIGEDEGGLRIHKCVILNNCLAIGCKKVIATNNPNIDVPKVVDEVDQYTMAKEYAIKTKSPNRESHRQGFVKGYNKSQETHPFSEEDMIEFAEWCQKPCLEDLRQPNVVYISSGNFYWYKHKKYTPKELLQLWKERNPKKVYYEN